MTAVTRSVTPRFLAGGEAALLIAGNGIGVACLAATWWRAAGTTDLSSDLSSAGLAIVGLVIAGLTNARWLLMARGSIARRRFHLSSRVSRWAAPPDSPSLQVAVAPTTASPSQSPAPRRLIAVEGATLYHRPGCPLVARKRAAAVTVGADDALELRPCGVCEPAVALGQDGTLQ